MRLNARHHAQKILALAEIYGADKVSRALQDAHEYKAYSCEYIANLLQQRARPLPEPGALHLTRPSDLLELDLPQPDLSVYERPENPPIDPLILAVSKITWDGLTPVDREIVKKTALEVMAWQKQAAREGLEGSTDATDNLKKNGMEVASLGPSEIAAFKAKTKAVYDKWTAEVGPDLVKAAEQIVAQTK